MLQSLHVLVVRGGLIQAGYCEEVALTSCYLSAVSVGSAGAWALLSTCLLLWRGTTWQ